MPIGPVEAKRRTPVVDDEGDLVAQSKLIE